ncbi:unnamed protein product [Ectocarpus sp. CCAP 1310/34]|nr:unnamed protein product [Ectocarpus sp. CCAP 1310/34]
MKCWCGTTDDYTRYGTGTCNFSCSGDNEQTCGGRESANVWTVD